jgi:hypothetical protein
MFIPRHPVVENQFCSYVSQVSGTGAAGVGGVVCYAGAVLYLVNGATNEEAEVSRYNNRDDQPTNAMERIPFGFAYQKVKTGYHQVHPTGFYMPGDLGSSDVIAQPQYNTSGEIIGTESAPLGVAHLGIYDTVHYACQFTGVAGTAAVVATGNRMKPGDNLYAACNCGSRVTNDNTAAGDNTYDGNRMPSVTTIVGRVVKGASADKCSANINNTTLYPIRIKLLV